MTNVRDIDALADGFTGDLLLGRGQRVRVDDATRQRAYSELAADSGGEIAEQIAAALDEAGARATTP
jgi:hypothetical protein